MSCLSCFCFFSFLTFAFCRVAHANDDSPRIVNGTDAQDGEFPFAVSLRYNTKHICGGTILDDKHVLTAAHCVCKGTSARNSSSYSIQYGLTEITKDEVNTIKVNEIYCHMFDPEKLIYDCAVLELESTLPATDIWTPVVLAKSFVADKPQQGTIIGWGRTGQNQPISRKLQKLEVNIHDDETCSKSWDTVHHICFGAENGGACNGDSGTALLIDNKQVGIASFITHKCGIATKKNPNIYSRVSSYYDWITDTINNTP